MYFVGNILLEKHQRIDVVEGAVNKNSRTLRTLFSRQRSPEKEKLCPFEKPTCLLLTSLLFIDFDFKFF